MLPYHVTQNLLCLSCHGTNKSREIPKAPHPAAPMSLVSPPTAGRWPVAPLDSSPAENEARGLVMFLGI